MSLATFLARWCSPCLLGHADDPLRTRKGHTLYWECRRCSQLLTPVLASTPVTPAAKRRRRKPPTPVLHLVLTKEARR